MELDINLRVRVHELEKALQERVTPPLGPLRIILSNYTVLPRCLRHIRPAARAKLPCRPAVLQCWVGT